MDNIKIKQNQLFKITPEGFIEIGIMNPALSALLNFKPSGAALRYDIQRRLTIAVNKALTDFSELRKGLLEELSVKKKVKLKSGNEFDSYSQIIDETSDSNTEDLILEIDGKKIKGKKILSEQYDLSENIEEFNKRFIELINIEIELDCKQISLTKLDAEKSLPVEIDFRALENFIIDDLNKD
jgi:hypothetical protein